jgi:hypothetical protein
MKSEARIITKLTYRDYRVQTSKSNPKEHPNLNKKLMGHNDSKGDETFMKLQSRLYSQN